METITIPLVEIKEIFLSATDPKKIMFTQKEQIDKLLKEDNFIISSTPITNLFRTMEGLYCARILFISNKKIK